MAPRSSRAIASRASRPRLGVRGAGYSAIKSPAMKLDLELGPAFRYTRFIDSTIESNVAARGSLDFGWKLSPSGISVTQNASAYVQEQRTAPSRPSRRCSPS
jgi:putative salt-induced outer membrane protein